MARRGREDLSRWIPASLRQEALVQQALEGFEVVPQALWAADAEQADGHCGIPRLWWTQVPRSRPSLT
jgi:hypothetical protein